MIRHRVLGTWSLTDSDGRNIPLNEPKLEALLAYLAVATPEGFHRRDTLLGLFWPRLRQPSARACLRNALHRLRKYLGAEVILTQGNELVRLAPHTLWCDASEFPKKAEEGDAAEAMELYQGEFLPGFHRSDAPSFERWLQEKRDHLSRLASRTAWELATTSVDDGERVQAALWARKAARLAPYDELAQRRAIELLHRMGDRAGALRTYSSLEERLDRDLGTEPSAATKELVQEIREPARTSV